MITKLESHALQSTDLEIHHRRLTKAKMGGDERNPINRIILPQLLALFDIKVSSYGHSGVLNGFTPVHFCL